LQKLGSQHVLVVHADDGLDELSIASTSHIAELKNGKITRYSVSPEQFGLPRGNLTELAVHDAASSLAMLTAVLDNQAGTARDIVLLNAGAAIYAADLTESLAAGIDLARSVLADGAARAKFSALVAFSQALS
jgi:anthranilate phosphoribosyltransferase